jgi:competence protein ComEC
VRGIISDGHCRLFIALAVRNGTSEAGSVVRVRGAELTEGDRGPLLRDGTITRLRGANALNRWRSRVAARLDRLFGADGPMVRALLIADTRGLDPALRDRYADAGLVHMLSISGLHVAIVGGALLLVLGALRLPPSIASGAAVGITVLYVVAIGAPAPAVRSATLFAATQLAQLWQRPVSPWGTFALGALVPLVEPRTVLDLGYQLSVTGYAAIVVSGRLGRRLPRQWKGWQKSLSKELIAGSLSTLATAPLVAWHFGRLSLVAPLSNLFAGPIISVLQPTLFATMLLPESFGAAFTADAARPLLRAMDAVALSAAALPGAAVVVAPTPLGIAMAIVGTTALLVAGWARHWVRPLIIALAAASVMLWLPDGLPARSEGMEVHLLDVGQGDAIALRTPKGRWVLVDAGRSWKSGDAGRATVIPYLRRRGGELALFVLTHPHADHIGGAASVIRALKPAAVRDAAFVEGSVGYRDLLRTASEVGTTWKRVQPGERIDVDGVELEFLAPDSAWTVALDDPNAASTVVRARYGAVRILLTGDAEAEEEGWLLRANPLALRAEVLKVGHHGSRTSSTEAFVDAVNPRLALVSVGAANTYGHPSPEVMQRLTAAGATVLRTDQLGTVVLRSDGSVLEVHAAGHRWQAAEALPPKR